MHKTLCVCVSLPSGVRGETIAIGLGSSAIGIVGGVLPAGIGFIIAGGFGGTFITAPSKRISFEITLALPVPGDIGGDADPRGIGCGLGPADRAVDARKRALQFACIPPFVAVAFAFGFGTASASVPILFAPCFPVDEFGTRADGNGGVGAIGVEGIPLYRDGVDRSRRKRRRHRR